MSPSDAKKKLYRFCAYQERCHQEIENKLREWRVAATDADEIIHHLIIEGFLNEERFARAFASGKFRQKQWGRLRIKQELEQRNLTAYCIKAGLNEIAEHDYEKTIRTLVLKKGAATEAENIFVLRDKISRFVIQKGFEPDLVWPVLRQHFPDKR
jgi:regulatory protein